MSTNNAANQEEGLQSLVKKSPFKQVEDIHLAALELTKDIGGLGAQKFADAVMTFVDAVSQDKIDTKADVNQLRQACEVQHQHIDQMQMELKHTAENLHTVISICKSLLGDVGLLKDIALGFRPAQTALAIKRELNDARFAVYQGFSLLFGAQLGLQVDKVVNGVQHYRAIEWPLFLASLDKLFLSHFTGGVQRKSVFSSARLSAFLNINVILQPLDPLPVPFNNFGGAKLDIVSDPHDDRFVLQRLEFFIPVVIWAFTELKKAILHDEDVIRAMQQKANSNQAVLNSITGFNTPLPFPEPSDRVDVHSTLQVGTAFAHRKDNTRWRDSYVRFKRRSPPVESKPLEEEPSSEKASTSTMGSHRYSSSEDEDRTKGPAEQRLKGDVDGISMSDIIQAALQGPRNRTPQELQHHRGSDGEEEEE
ncbi:hypothetical protein SCHPADRAFT_948178 [Schizopora paradoxa]|uniref:Uncharacterized protein n=1 Tax=Schizopora paradoxa TaxID=27342 RepID=A0A0H2R3B2_9AGAM|nr:hypothetical protein SCHPADRAFT_948178 [Schizopora paradoxa]